MGDYMILWTDMHSNLHHEDINELPAWLEQIRQTMDFWPIAYYPYYMRMDECGLGVEDVYEEKEIQGDWEYIRQITEAQNGAGFPMFMGYEWQGAGLDGDHNVFFRDNGQDMAFPLRYKDLIRHYGGVDAIGIPHHTAYQLANRGKNWTTHDDAFSPFAEIYSSHGSSENDAGPIAMERHIHMGPRSDGGSAESGWKAGHRFGVIAAGDNHSCPGVYGFGYTAVLAKGRTKEDIWDAFIHRRVYGVSRDRIRLDFTVDGHPMGDMAAPSPKAKLRLDVTGSNAIDRIEIIRDNVVSEMIPHTSTWEQERLAGQVRVKFQVEFGWGPDRRVFPDIEKRSWHGSLKTDGQLISVEKCWSNFGQKLYDVTENSCQFDLTTYKTTATGKWMGPSAVTTEGFIFEVEADIDSAVELTVDGVRYELPVRDMLESSRVIPLEEEARQLLKDRFGFTEYYRSDPWWHNCYKIKIGRAVPAKAYERTIEREIDTTDCKQVRVRVWQRNGAAAWSSPVFFEEGAADV